MQKLGLALLLIWSLGASAAIRDNAVAGLEPRERQKEQRGIIAVTASELSGDPYEYFGRTVRVKAKVARVHNRHVFALDERAIFGGPDVLVVARELTQLPNEGSTVTVIARVHEYREWELLKHYGWFLPAWFTEISPSTHLGQRPILVAQSIQSGRRELLAAPQRDRKLPLYERTLPAQKPAPLQTTNVTGNLPQFVGKRVTLQAYVAHVFGPGVFTIDNKQGPRGADVLVIAPGGVRAPTEGSRIQAVGTIRAFSRDMHDDYSWFGPAWNGYYWSYYDDVWKMWERRPSIIADSIKSELGSELVLQPVREPPRPGLNPAVFVTGPSKILAYPAAYLNQLVRLTGVVGTVPNVHAFTLSDSSSGDGNLLVVMPLARHAIPEDQRVTIVGEVRRFTLPEFKKQFDWLQLTGPRESDLPGNWDNGPRPVVVARSVRTEDGREFNELPLYPSSVGAPTDRGSLGRGKSAGPDLIRELDGILGARPETIVGRQVDLSRVEVQKMLSERAALIGFDRERNVLTRLPGPFPQLSAGQQVRVRGVIKQLPQDLSGWGLQKDTAHAMANRRIYVEVSDITPL